MGKKQKRKVQKSKNISTEPQVPIGKQRLFQVLLVVIPMLFFLFLEIGLRIFQYGENTDLFVSTPDESSEFFGINPNVSKRYFSKIDFLPTPRKDLFLKQKPANCYRIFVLGGSTTAGFPYGNNLMFTRILHRRLMETFPERRIEMVNTAFSAINSYTLLDFMDEIVDYGPDALLIYAGHNEFYGALGVGSLESAGRSTWLVKLYLKLQRYKSFELLRNMIIGLFKSFSGSENITDPSATAMARIVKEQTIPLHSGLYQDGKKQFYENMAAILQKAQKAHIPVLLSELVSNIRDQAPFISERNDTLPAALDVFKKARELEKNSRLDEARIAYYQAKDLDLLRFRAPEEFNQIIHELAEKFEVSLVPMQSYFENASPNGLIGTNLIHEHVHPNIDGYFLMADAFYETMRKEKFISKAWDENRIKTSDYYKKIWGTLQSGNTEQKPNKILSSCRF
jgi:lysophospholipase L1-like esterase